MMKIVYQNPVPAIKTVAKAQKIVRCENIEKNDKNILGSFCPGIKVKSDITWGASCLTQWLFGVKLQFIAFAL